MLILFVDTFYRHHCRNCGYVICNACSQNFWPSSMLPSFYYNKEKYVRICDDCNTLMLVFVDALKAGDQATALAVFNTGNVNLHRPFSLFASGANAVRTVVCNKRFYQTQCLYLFLKFSRLELMLLGSLCGDGWKFKPFKMVG